MSRVIVNGGHRLKGSVVVQGSKNSMLPIMAAALLNKNVTVISNCPDIADVHAMQEILEYIGCTIKKNGSKMIIDSKGAYARPIPADISSKLRASCVLMGPMLSRFGYVDMAHPGGCSIGKRPLDIHMNAFKRLGASWQIDEKHIFVSAVSLHGNIVHLRLPSVGATQNTIMAAVLSSGRTVIENAAKEPEVLHLCDYLKKAGANIKGDGSDVITIYGVDHLNRVSYEIPADRIVTGTYIAAAAVCKGDIFLKNCSMHDCMDFLDVYSGMGVLFSNKKQGMRVQMKHRAVNLNYIKTGPYPQFPTDMQSITLSVAATAEGELIMQENVFENRFKTVRWLNAMGADIKIHNSTAKVCGVKNLSGTDVYADDLRGSAALIVAAISARSSTIIHDADYLKRGYYDLCENLNELGADIRWENN